MQSGSSITVERERERYQFTIKNPRDIWSRSASSLAAKCLVTAVTDRPVFRWRFHDWGRRWLVIRKHIPEKPRNEVKVSYIDLRDRLHYGVQHYANRTVTIESTVSIEFDD